ncbi:shikimate kinase [candidate division KSB1 bacterium]|nr:shikimate kinase [candidate division KSB1 bacterium]
MLDPQKNIVLIGMRGSGKTTIGVLLASKLHREFIPMDAMIVYDAGMTIPEIVEHYGWDHFRSVETKVTKRVAQLKSTVNATGGGVILRQENIDALRRTGVVIWLRVSVDNTLKRIGEDPNRPSLTGKASRMDDMLATLQEREPLYTKAAHYIIDTEGKTQDEIADEIVALLENIE